MAEHAALPALETESKFERYSIRFLAGGFAFFIALATHHRDARRRCGVGLSGVVLVLAVFLLMVIVAVYGLPRDEPSVISESERRFYELADPTRPLTTDHAGPARGGPLEPAEPREHEG